MFMCRLKPCKRQAEGRYHMKLALAEEEILRPVMLILPRQPLSSDGPPKGILMWCALVSAENYKPYFNPFIHLNLQWRFVALAIKQSQWIQCRPDWSEQITRSFSTWTLKSIVMQSLSWGVHEGAYADEDVWLILTLKCLIVLHSICTACTWIILFC